MDYSYVSHLYCPQCEKTYSTDEINQLCECGSPLLVSYRMEELKKQLKKEDLLTRKPDLWRYHELLPVSDPASVVTLGEGMTPLLHLKRAGADMGLSNLYM